VRQTPEILVLGVRRGAHQAERKTAPRLGHAGQLQPLARRGAGRPLVAADRKQHLRAGPPTWLGTCLPFRLTALLRRNCAQATAAPSRPGRALTKVPYPIPYIYMGGGGGARRYSERPADHGPGNRGDQAPQRLAAQPPGARAYLGRAERAPREEGRQEGQAWAAQRRRCALPPLMLAALGTRIAVTAGMHVFSYRMYFKMLRCHCYRRGCTYQAGAGEGGQQHAEHCRDGVAPRRRRTLSRLHRAPAMFLHHHGQCVILSAEPQDGSPLSSVRSAEPTQLRDLLHESLDAQSMLAQLREGVQVERRQGAVVKWLPAILGRAKLLAGS